MIESNVSNLMNFSNISANPVGFGSQPITLTFSDVLGTFSKQFIQRMELFVLAFLIVMIFLQYYTKQIEKEVYRNKKWSEHITNVLNIKPILSPEIESSPMNFWDKLIIGYLHPSINIPFRDKILMLISDILFLPAVAFALIFLGFETGWFL